MDSDIPGMIPKDQFKGTLGLRLRTAPGRKVPPPAELEPVDAAPSAGASAATAPGAPDPVEQPGPPAAGGMERIVSKLGHLFYWKKDY